MTHQATQIDGQLVANLELAELLHLSDWCSMRRVAGQYEHFTRWLWAVLEAEKARRDQVDVDPEDIALPWDAGFLSDALPACYVLSRLALTTRLAAFIDAVDRHAMCAASAVLSELKVTLV